MEGLSAAFPLTQLNSATDGNVVDNQIISGVERDVVDNQIISGVERDKVPGYIYSEPLKRPRHGWTWVLKGWVRDSGGEVARFFSKNGGNTSLIRKNPCRKICNSEPLSHHEKTEFQFPGQSTNSKRNSSARLTC